MSRAVKATCEVCLRPICCRAKNRAKCQMYGTECHGGGGCYQIGYERVAPRAKELRAELDAAATLHREVKVRLEAENTRLIGALAQMFEVCDCGEAHRPTCIGAHDGQAGYGCDACCAHERNENDADGWCVPLRPASDKNTDCKPPAVEGNGQWSTGEPRQ